MLLFIFISLYFLLLCFKILPGQNRLLTLVQSYEWWRLTC